MTNGAPYTADENRIIATSEDYTSYTAECVFYGTEPRTIAAYKRQRWLLKRGNATAATVTEEAGPVIDRTRFLSSDPDTDAEWEHYFSLLEDADEKRETLADSTRSVVWDSPVPGPIGVAFLSDIHAGASGVLYKRFRQDIETIAATEGLYAVMNGDLFEGAKVMSKAGNALYSSAFASQKDQYQYIRRRMLLAQGKWIVVTGGNHDSRDYQTAGLDRLPDLCNELGVPYATETGATVTLTVGSQVYTVVVKHDYRGKSQLNKSNSMRRLWDEWPHSWQNADVVALAHLHEPDLHETMRKGEPVVYLRSGSYKVVDSWAESAGYKPQYGVPIVIFDPDTRFIQPVRDFAMGVRVLRAARAEWAASRPNR
jgi:predicted phosphodiesterase